MNISCPNLIGPVKVQFYLNRTARSTAGKDKIIIVIVSLLVDTLTLTKETKIL